MYIYAVRIIGSSSDEAWELKLHAFRNLGFYEDDILSAFRNSPSAFAVSVEKMKKVREILVSSGKYDMACIISHPNALICSIEKEYKPRLQILATLESPKLIKKWPCFKTFFSIPSEKFLAKFVSPYIDEVSHLFVAKSVNKRGEILPST